MADAHKASRKQEAATAKAYKGSRNVMSGGGWMRKGDVRSEDFLIESKIRMDKKSYTLKLQELRKLKKEAVLTDRIPVFQVEMGGYTYVVLDEDDFMEMING